MEVPTPVGMEPSVRYHPLHVVALTPWVMGDSASWAVYLGRVPPKG